jgi:hypothetical protein
MVLFVYYWHNKTLNHVGCAIATSWWLQVRNIMDATDFQTQIKEELKDTKVVLRIRKSKDRQLNGLK